MAIIACGINHKTAPVALREKVAFAADKLPEYLNDLLVNEQLANCVILSTCNRSDVYCITDNPDVIVAWYCRQHQLTFEEIETVFYLHHGQAAIQHIMNVAAGLDSLIVGEPQIFGQMKDAFSESCAAGCVGTQFNRLFQQVFSVAKEIRTTTAIGACPVSIASATVSLAKQSLPELDKAVVLLLGAGDTSALILRHLQAFGVKKIVIANRNVANAEKLVARYGGEAIDINGIAQVLVDADLVISATGSPIPILTMESFHLAQAVGRCAPIYLIDIAVPRDIDATVSELPYVYLSCIDDLKMIIQQNKQGRQHAAEKAQQIIYQKSQEALVTAESFEKVTTTIRAYRKQIEAICCSELVKATRQLKNGEDPCHVLASFANAYTNKILHIPSVQLREAGHAGRWDLLQFAQQLFAIPLSELSES